MQLKLKSLEEHKRKLEAWKDQFLADVQEKIAAREAELKKWSSHLDARGLEWDETRKSSQVWPEFGGFRVNRCQSFGDFVSQRG